MPEPGNPKGPPYSRCSWTLRISSTRAVWNPGRALPILLAVHGCHRLAIHENVEPLPVTRACRGQHDQRQRAVVVDSERVAEPVSGAAPLPTRCLTETRVRAGEPVQRFVVGDRHVDDIDDPNPLAGAAAHHRYAQKREKKDLGVHLPAGEKPAGPSLPLAAGRSARGETSSPAACRRHARGPTSSPRADSGAFEPVSGLHDTATPRRPVAPGRLRPATA